MSFLMTLCVIYYNILMYTNLLSPKIHLNICISIKVYKYIYNI